MGWAGLDWSWGATNSSQSRVMKRCNVKENESKREMCIRYSCVSTKASKNNMKCTYIYLLTWMWTWMWISKWMRKVAEACRDCWRCWFSLVNCVNKGVSSTVCVNVYVCVWVCVQLYVCALIYCVHQVTLTHLKFDEAAPQCFFRIVPHKLWWDSPPNGIW